MGARLVGGMFEAVLLVSVEPDDPSDAGNGDLEASMAMVSKLMSEAEVLVRPTSDHRLGLVAGGCRDGLWIDGLIEFEFDV
jgi:hypothetical protein